MQPERRRVVELLAEPWAVEPAALTVILRAQKRVNCPDTGIWETIWEPEKMKGQRSDIRVTITAHPPFFTVHPVFSTVHRFFMANLKDHADNYGEAG